MSVEHLDLLHEQLPELFAVKELPESWDDDLIIVSVPDVELIGEAADAMVEETAALPIHDLPEGVILDHAGPNYINLRVPPPVLSEKVIQILRGNHGGEPVPYTDRSKMPPPDCLAFYLPYHYYHPDWWGIYLIYEGVLWLAAEIIRRSKDGVNPRQAFEASRLFLYYHEAFHHKTECFSTRLELTHREALYKNGFEQYFKQTFWTKDCLEEGLANASALTETSKKTKDSKIDDALAGYVAESPPGYDQGNKFRRVSRRIRCEFVEKNQRVCLPHLPFKDPEIWNTAPHLFDGIANMKSNVNYLLSRSSPLVAQLPFRPCLPPRKLIKKLQGSVGLKMVREGSRHQVWRTAAGNIVEIPRHARDLGRGLLRSILRQAGVDMGLEEFLRT